MHSLEHELSELQDDLNVEVEARNKFEKLYDKVAPELETMKHKKEKYQKNYEKYHKMTSKMRQDIQRLEESNQELMDEVKVLMS